MQLLELGQMRWPAGHPHRPPGPEHTWPLTVQSSPSQQVLLAMQLIDTSQVFLPEPQPQVPPGAEHV